MKRSMFSQCFCKVRNANVLVFWGKVGSLFYAERSHFCVKSSGLYASSIRRNTRLCSWSFVMPLNKEVKPLNWNVRRILSLKGVLTDETTCLSRGLTLAKTTTDDATAAITCVQHTRNRSMRRTSVCFANADHVEIKSLTTVNQVHSLRAVVQKET